MSAMGKRVKFNFGTWNVQGADDKKGKYLADMIVDNHIEVMNLQELPMDADLSFLPAVVAELAKTKDGSGAPLDYGFDFSSSKRNQYQLEPKDSRMTMADDVDMATLNPSGINDGYGTLYNNGRFELKDSMSPVQYEHDDAVREEVTRQVRQPTRTRTAKFAFDESHRRTMESRMPMASRFGERATGEEFNVVNWHAPEGGGGGRSGKYGFSGRDAVPAMEMFGKSDAFSRFAANKDTVMGMDSNVRYGHMQSELGVSMGDDLDSHHLDHILAPGARVEEGFYLPESPSDHDPLFTEVELG